MKKKKVEALSKTYTNLLKELKSILIEGLRKIEEERVNTYWRTGKVISRHLLASQQHGDGLFIRLSDDLGIGKRTLERSVQFYKTFPIASDLTRLIWSHYVLLLSVKDESKRNFYRQEAIKKGWDSIRLQEAIRIERLKRKDLTTERQTAPKLKLIRSSLSTYKLIKSDCISLEQSELLVDCGFNVWREIPLRGLKNPCEGDIVVSFKKDNEYKFKSSEAKTSQLYTYKAFVERVIDADTIWVNIDLGFKNWARQKLRFRGIDAPEISTQKGEKAKQFVEATLSKVKFIIIRSASLDKYGRPLSDIFYLENENNPQVVLEKGIFLNQQLLDLGLAKVMDD